VGHRPGRSGDVPTNRTRAGTSGSGRSRFRATSAGSTSDPSGSLSRTRCRRCPSVRWRTVPWTGSAPSCTSRRKASSPWSTGPESPSGATSPSHPARATRSRPLAVSCASWPTTWTCASWSPATSTRPGSASTTRSV